MRDPTPVLDKPTIVKEMPNSLFPKLQAITKSPTTAKIAPKTQVSTALTNQQFMATFLKSFVIPQN
jgi:hypothetical protein